MTTLVCEYLMNSLADYTEADRQAFRMILQDICALAAVVIFAIAASIWTDFLITL